MLRSVSTAIAKLLNRQPSVQFRRNRNFYLNYDGGYLIGETIVFALLLSSGWQGFLPSFDASLLLWLPLVCYIQILCSVVIHNCAHGNVIAPFNRIVGELCGVVVLTRFASWEIIHRRHHLYSDDTVRDPHPCQRNYWKFTWHMLLNVERQLQQQFFDLHGHTDKNKRFEQRRVFVSYGTGIMLVACWYLILGPGGFFLWFVPSTIVGILHLAHFNWSTHNGFDDNLNFRPVNLDRGFFWLGNRIWFGIYYHDNHHRDASIFDPRHMEAIRSKRRQKRGVQGVGLLTHKPIDC